MAVDDDLAGLLERWRHIGLGDFVQEALPLDLPPLSATPDLGKRLRDIQEMVATFHSVFGLPISARPTTMVPEGLARLRVRLQEEETEELAEAIAARDLSGIADALADIVYVAFGTAVTYGIDLNAVLREVHRSNLSKLDAAGRPVLRDDGKVVKSERYRPPDVDSVLANQLRRRDETFRTG